VNEQELNGNTDNGIATFSVAEFRSFGIGILVAHLVLLFGQRNSTPVELKIMSKLF
jgi:hypothetical protein